MLAQRLMRKVCPHCVADHQPTPQEFAWLRALFPEHAEASFRKGTGCHQCLNTGYLGRVPVAELLEMDADLSGAVRQNDTVAFMGLARRQKQLIPLPKAGLHLAIQGITTLDEAIRLSGDSTMLPAESDAVQADSMVGRGSGQ